MVRLTLGGIALFALGVWSVLFVLGHSNVGLASVSERASRLCVYGSVWLALAVAVVQEGMTYRYGAPGFLSGYLGDNAVHVLVRIAYPGLFAFAALSVLTRVATASTRWQDRTQLAVWVPYLAAWSVGVAIGRFPGALPSAWASLAAIIPIVMLRSIAGTHRLSRFVQFVARILTTGSLFVAEMARARAWAPYSVWPGGWRPGAPRLQGLFSQPDVLGAVAALALLLEVGRKAKRWNYLFAGIALLDLGLSGARAPAVAAAIALLMMPSAKEHVGVPRRLRQAALFGASGVFVYLAVIEGQNVGTLNGRSAHWAQAWAVFLQNPSTGSGPGAYVEYSAFQAASRYAHNQVLQTAAELGVIGLAALGVHVTALLFDTWRNRRARLLVSATIFWLVMFVPDNLLRFTDVSSVVPLLLFALILYVAHSPPLAALNVRYAEHPEVVTPSTQGLAARLRR